MFAFYTKNVHMMSQFSMTFMWNPVLPLWCLETFTTKITGLWLELMTINRKFINQHKTITCTSYLYNIYSCYDIAEILLKLALNTNPGIDINFWTNMSHRLNFTCPKVKTTCPKFYLLVTCMTNFRDKTGPAGLLTFNF